MGRFPSGQRGQTVENAALGGNPKINFLG